MIFHLSSFLSIGEESPKGTDSNPIPYSAGFAYAEELSDAVTWHISGTFTTDGKSVSWDCINPDLALVDGVLFTAGCIMGDPAANEALAFVSRFITAGTEILDDDYTHYLNIAKTISSKYQWGVTMWPRARHRWSYALLDFPKDTAYFLHSEKNGPSGDSED